MFVGKTIEGGGRPDLVGNGPACGVCDCDLGVVEAVAVTVLGRVAKGEGLGDMVFAGFAGTVEGLGDVAVDGFAVAADADGFGEGAVVVGLALDVWFCLKRKFGT